MLNQSKTFQKLFERDLLKLREEISSYSEEGWLWVKEGEIKNSAGNLAMHVCGNLQHFIGTILHDTGYKRNRTFEFEGKLKSAELLSQIDETIEIVNSYFTGLDENNYSASYPIEVFGYTMTVFEFITHLYGHLNYHLGQVNYHRRILANV